MLSMLNSLRPAVAFLSLSSRSIITTTQAFSITSQQLQKSSKTLSASFKNKVSFISRKASTSSEGISPITSTKTTSATSSSQSNNNNILILDHININHEKGRHDLLKSFYFEYLQCSIDQRKYANLEKGSSTLWANIGAHQFHLPEGSPHAQVLNGFVTMLFPVDSYKDMKVGGERYANVVKVLDQSEFQVNDESDDNEKVLHITDPWGTNLQLIFGSSTDTISHQSKMPFTYDERGIQDKGLEADGYSISDLTLFVSVGTNLSGIGRFYEQILGANVSYSYTATIVSMGPYQTLTFKIKQSDDQDDESDYIITHVDLRDEKVEEQKANNKPYFPSNYGPHISLYVSDIRSTYQRVRDLGVDYVNPRFKRRAYNEEEVVDDCMFRCLDIVDPENANEGTILQLEHEVRSVVKRDGSKYKSCPFDNILDNCVV